jgi:rubrerythrin
VEAAVGQDKDAQGVVEALAAHEYAIGELYAAFALRFRHETALWQGLADEERGHGDALHSLRRTDEGLSAFLDASRFDPRQIAEETRRLRELSEVVGYSGLSLREALATAIELERSVAESRAFQVVPTDGPAVSQVLARLREQTRRHEERLQSAMVRLSRP